MSDEKYSTLEIHNDIFNSPHNILSTNQRGVEIQKMDFTNNIDHINHKVGSLQQEGLSQQALLHLLLEISRQTHIQTKCLTTEIKTYREEITNSIDKKVHDLLLLVKNLHQEILNETQLLKNENTALKNELKITRSMLSNFFEEYLPSMQYRPSESTISSHHYDHSQANPPVTRFSSNTGVRIPTGLSADRQNFSEKPGTTGLHSFLENFNNLTVNATNKPPFDITGPRGRFFSAVESDFLRDRRSSLDLLFADLPHRFNNHMLNNSTQINNSTNPNSSNKDSHILPNQAEFTSNSLKLLGNFHNNPSISVTNNNSKSHTHKDRFQLLSNSLVHLGDNNTLNTSSSPIHSSGSSPSKALLHNQGFNSPQSLFSQSRINSGIPSHEFDTVNNENPGIFLSEPSNILTKAPLRKPDVIEKENNHLENYIRELDSKPNGNRNRSYSIASSSREAYEQNHSQPIPSQESLNLNNNIIALHENVNPKLESSFLTSKENLQNALLRLEWRIRNVSVLATHSQHNGSVTSTFSDPDGELDDILLRITMCSCPSSNDDWVNSHYGLALSIPYGKVATYVFQCGNERKRQRTHDFSISEWDGYDDFGKFGDFVDPVSNTLHIILDILELQ